MKRPIRIFLCALVLIPFIGISCQKKNPVIEIQTPKGNIIIELYIAKAPVTAGNFLKMVKDHVLDGRSFYRTVRSVNDTNPVKISVLQGGTQGKDSLPDIKPIEHETTKMTGIKHLDGVISMARTTPGSARTEFFICIGDQPELDFGGRRNPDGQGFAAFGKVIEGMTLVQEIWQGPAAGQKIDPPMRIHKVVVR
ncbi:MAG: peptidylprolyl isomerase [Porphyromonadaceae bacterium]|nr:MAG: peptidylprolyl isomerase [Porphyromonadaceae bacterium]